MNDVGRWLPVSERQVEALQERLVAATSAWTKRWLVASELRVGKLQALTSQEALDQVNTKAWGGHARGFAISFDSSHLDILQTAMLGKAGYANDGPVWSEFRRRLPEVLFDMLKGAVPVIAQRGIAALEASEIRTMAQTGGVSAELRLATTPIAEVFISSRLLNDEVAHSSVSTAGLTSRAAALQTSRTRLAIVGGSAELTLDELSGLAVGDVIVLDRKTIDPVDVVVEATSGIVGSALLHKDGTQLTVRVSSLRL